MVGRELTATECRLTDLERWLLGACWCVRRLARYTMYVPWVQVAVPNAAMFAALQLADLHCKVQALYLELQSYNVKIVDGLGAWDIATTVREAAATEPDPIERRTWSHVDCTISSTRRPPPALAIDARRAFRVYFDGGCKKRLGAGGAVVFSPEG